MVGAQGNLFGPTLEEAREQVRANLSDGIRCPCCTQLCKLYQRSINGDMCRALIWLVRAHQRHKRYYHISEFPLLGSRKGGNDYSKLAYWELIEREPNTDNPRLPSTHSGMWRPTPIGIAFAENRWRLPKYAMIFDDTLHSYRGDDVTVIDCLPTYFDFWETWG